MKRRLLGDKHPEIALGLNNLAVMYQDKGDLVHAESTYREALAMQRELLGATHPDVAQTLNNLAFVQYDRGDTAGALASKREALAVYRRVFPKDHPDVARVMNQIGFWLTQAGQYEEADHDLQEALAMRRRLFGNSHPDVATSLVHVAILQVARREYDEALVSARDAVAILSAAVSPTHWKTAVGESVEGAALTGLGQYPAAEKQLLRGYTILSDDTGVVPMYRELARRYVQDLYRRWGRPQDVRRSRPPSLAPLPRRQRAWWPRAQRRRRHCLHCSDRNKTPGRTHLLLRSSSSDRGGGKSQPRGRRTSAERSSPR